MKVNVLIAMLMVAVATVARSATPVEPVAAGTEVTKADLSPNQQAFLNLPEEKRQEFIKHLTEANRVFQQKRIFEALDESQKAAGIFKDSAEVYNLRGSCYVEIRAFDKAMAEFKKADGLAKDHPSIEFNIAEVYFITKRWSEALALFEKVFKKVPEQNIALSRLVEFKILLCKNRLGMKKDVAAMAEKYDFLDDSPYYFYAKAALAYDVKDLGKAEEWLAIANRIFRNPNVIAPWQDTLVEYGYIKSLYGGADDDE